MERRDASGPTDTFVIVDADVRTQSVTAPVATAVAWRDGAILAVGTREEVSLCAGPDARTWSVHGATVLPGFVDAHHHASIAALYGGTVRLAPPAVTDIASLQRALAEADATLPPDAWLVATDWDEALLAERRAPTRRELDDAVPRRPLFAMHYSCHRALANSRALALAGITRATPDPDGGAISRGARGEPDGLLVERGISRVESLARAALVTRDAAGFFSRLAGHHRELVTAGITRIVDAAVPADLATLYYEAARRGDLRVPTVIMPVSITGWLECPRDAIDGTPTERRDALVRVGPLKLVFDGAPTCALCLSWWQSAGVFVRSCAATVRDGTLDPLRAAFSTRPRMGTKLRTGIRIYNREEARDIVHAAIDRGFALATHAIGNDAVDLALQTYESAGPALFRAGAAPRIEHASFLDRPLVARIAAVGASVVMQPHFVTLPSFASAPSIPGLRYSPLRWLLDAGVRVAGSSDYPVLGFDPLDGIRSAVDRRTRLGHVLEPDQCVAMDEAIAMYTRVAAEVSGCLDVCGTLEPGKRADLVVLDRALGDPGSLASARVRVTVLGGDVMHGDLGV